MKDLAKAVGTLHGLVHSAGISLTQPLKTLSYSDYSAIFRVNLDAAVMLSKGFRQKGVRAESGSSVVYLSSTAALKGSPALAVYGASKAGLISLARALAVELAADKIRVNCVYPGLVETDMFQTFASKLSDEQLRATLGKYPLGFGKPDDVAYAVAFLLAPSARWITGVNLVLDGGYTA
jgi:NAD(P)-dependent dehydrogenase (short-subunit alcohol dehydrogenase family)